VILALMQAVHSLARYGNPMLTGIGMLSYFAPIPAVVLAHQFALRRGMIGISLWMRFYVVLASLALISVYLEYSGVVSQILGEVGGGVFISGAGAYYKGNSGIFRGAEIAAWHAATAACFSFMLLWGRRLSIAKVILALALVGFFVGLGILTGRRKMIIEVAIFMSTFVALVVWFRHRAGKMAILVSIFGMLVYLGTVGLVTPSRGEVGSGRAQEIRTQDSSFSKYSRRAKSVFADVPDRINEMGIQPVGWAVNQFGWQGAGLGVGSQGTAHFGVNTSGAAEGGLGKLTVELGLPGVALVGWLLISFVLYIWRLLAPLARNSPKHANLAFGLIAFMLANLAAFSVATQAYADIFVLLTLGWCLGFLLALPVLANTDKDKALRELQEAESGAGRAGRSLAMGRSVLPRPRFAPGRMLPPRR
jgi:hypothetical protein